MTTRLELDLNVYERACARGGDVLIPSRELLELVASARDLERMRSRVATLERLVGEGVNSLECVLDTRRCAPRHLRVLNDMRRAAPSAEVNLSCLVCGHVGERGVWHEPSGVWACIECRNAGQLKRQGSDVATLLNRLRAEDGSSVAIMCQNADFNGQPNEAIEVSASWTNWEPRRFTGDTLAGALWAAIRAMPLDGCA